MIFFFLPSCYLYPEGIFPGGDQAGTGHVPVRQKNAGGFCVCRKKTMQRQDLGGAKYLSKNQEGSNTMFRKIIVWLLIMVVAFQWTVFHQAFAAFSPEGGGYEITYYGQAPWEGEYPMVGDSYLYLEVRGYGLHSLDGIEAYLYEKDANDEYISVASSTEGIYLGANQHSEDVYVFKLELHEDKTLEDAQYYIEIVDDQGKEMLSGKKLLFTPNSSSGPAWVESVSISEMAEGLASVRLETKVRSFKSGQPKEAFSAEIVQGDVDEWGGLQGNISTVGFVISDSLTVNELEGGVYSLNGEFSLSEGINPDIPVFVKVVGPVKSGAATVTGTAYNYSGIPILSSSSPAVRNLEISNAYRAMSYQHGNPGGAEASKYYVSEDQSELAFSFSSTAMPEPSKIDLKLTHDGNIVGGLIAGSLEAEMQNNGLYAVRGRINAAGGSLGSHDLEVYYDNAFAGKGTVIYTDAKGAEGISYEGSYSHFSKPYPVYAGDSIEIVMAGALNMALSGFAGSLFNTDDLSEVIPLDITAGADGADIRLSLTPASLSSGTYILGLTNDGEEIKMGFYSWALIVARR